ncbi:MAG: type VI secretion system Vgr family protein [Gemmataceae bacterium]
MPTATANATQKNRHAALKTPLGEDVLLITAFTGEECISTMFEYHVDCVAAIDKKVEFDKLIGQVCSVKVVYPEAGKQRYFNGICLAVSQGESDVNWVHYRLDLVPTLWLLDYRVQSRIFQHISVPDILKKVLQGLEVTFDLKGKYEKRDYCVQYRESDYWFAARLMEEEGIYFYFTHAEGGHTMIVSDHSAGHKDLAYQPSVLYKHVPQYETPDEDCIYAMEKRQQLTCGKVTLRDHSPELTGKNLEAQKEIQESVQVGTTTHKLKVGQNGQLEIYQYPGEYAQRFDGINAGGGDQADDVKKIFDDNVRTATLRMQAEAARSIELSGKSTCRQFSCGQALSVKVNPGDPQTAQLGPEGKYVLTFVSHDLTAQGEYASGGSSQGFSYKNTFTVIPYALPYRPQRAKEKPTVQGCQTATVVGPAGEEIFVDKYGRVKVQFHWDREGKKDAGSSCWIRVGTNSAGRGWGIYSIPRIGQEVIVDFLEGDPDQPIIVGSVFNNDQMPAYKLPDNKTKMYIKTNSTPGGAGHNEICLEDKKGHEQIQIHAEKDMHSVVENNCFEAIGVDRHLAVGHDRVEDVGRDQVVNIQRDLTENIQRNATLLVGANQTIIVQKDKSEHIQANSNFIVDQNHMVEVGSSFSMVVGQNMAMSCGKNFTMAIGAEQILTVGADQHTLVGGTQTVTVKKDHFLSVHDDQRIKVGGNLSTKVQGSEFRKVGESLIIRAADEIHLKATKIILEAEEQITIKGPGGFVDISAAATAIKGAMVLINSGGAAGAGKGGDPASPEEAKKAEQAKKPTKPVPPAIVKVIKALKNLTGSKSN